MFTDGVFFLSMAPVDLPESIIPALADALGIVFSGPADPKLQVINSLRTKKTLLVLDNMEHLIAGSDNLGEILQESPDVKMLLTSREHVHLQWEWIFEVQGLPVPEEVSSTALESRSAATLFLQRARQTTAHFHLSPEDVLALGKICTLVDGLPLAIELAASWVRVMSFSEIAHELERDMGLLETTMHDVPTRHRSIKTVFDHSWALLTMEERAVLMRLSVFSGGFTRKAAEAVAGASLLLLSSLVGKSLLRYSKKEGRYDFHELIHQYCTARLHEHPAVAVEAFAGHSHYFSDWLAGLEASLKSIEQSQTSMRIRSETANWISAWRWAVQNRKFDLLRQMIPSLSWYFEIHGYYEEALTTNQYAVSNLREAGAPGNLPAALEKSVYASLLNQYGWFLFRTGNLEQATTIFRESLDLARDSQNQETLFYIQSNWGYLALLNGDIAEAKRLTLESLANAQQLHSQWHTAIPITTLGIVEYQQGNLSEAYQQLSDSLKIWRAVGDPRGLIFCMLYLSSTALALGYFDIVEAIVGESNAIAIDKMDRWAQAFGLDLLGQVAMLKRDHPKARELFGQSLALSNEIGDKWAGTRAIIHLGEALASLEMDQDSKRLFRQAYFNAQQARWVPTILEALTAFVSIEQEMMPETRLAVTLSILSHPAISPSIRQQAVRLRERLSS